MQFLCDHVRDQTVLPNNTICLMFEHNNKKVNARKKRMVVYYYYILTRGNLHSNLLLSLTTPMPKPTGYGTRPHPLTFHIHNRITLLVPYSC